MSAVAARQDLGLPNATGSRGGNATAPAGLPLAPATAAGEALVAILDELAPALAERAPVHDRDGSFPFASLAELQAAGVLAAPVPVELGGLGVTRLHELVVAAVTLARADASLAIGVNMHVVLVHALERVRAHQASRGRGTPEADAVLRDVATGTTIMAAAISERGQVLGRPSTRATVTPDGWLVEGGKIFCTLSPAATVLQTAVSYVTDSGEERYAYVPIPIDLPGVVIHDDWDALGMRASGSHSVTFAGVELPRDALRGGFPIGDDRAYLRRNVAAGLLHAAASLGVAEAAAQAVRGAGPDARTVVLAAENAIDLAATRSIVARAATLVDEAEADIVTLFAEAQAAKAFANEAAVRVADRALALSGGAGYSASSPLARHYRDARAGSFMHPLGANRAYDFLGELMLGREPRIA